MITCELVHIITVQNQLGESILYDEEHQQVWWTDIQASVLYQYSLVNNSVKQFQTPERLCSFGLTHQRDVLIAAFATGIAYYAYETAQLRWLARPDLPNPGLRFNDGRVDRQGRFWSGTMIEDPQQSPSETAKLYCLDRDLKLHHRDSGFGISNGLCWSPDSSKLYFADSAQSCIFVYDFDSMKGTISNQKVFAKTPEYSAPDGSEIDAEGYMWNAQWGGSCVTRYCPDGNIDFILELEVSQPTCIAFGGDNLDHLFITSARDGLSDDVLNKQPNAGNVLVYKLNKQGLPSHRFPGLIENSN